MKRPQDWSPKTLYVVVTELNNRRYWLRDLYGDPPQADWVYKESEAGTFTNRREAELWAKRVGIMEGGIRTWVEEVD